MPMMKMSHRSSDVWVSTPYGFAYLFKPNVPVMVDPQCVLMCQSMGAAFVNAEDEQVLPGNVSGPRAVASPPQKHAMLLELFAKMIEDQVKYRDNFTAAGRPNLRWVQKELREEFGADQIETAWAEAKAAAAG
jgi:hypothetical protein